MLLNKPYKRVLMIKFTFTNEFELSIFQMKKEQK
jgi:hypothetical protein